MSYNTFRLWFSTDTNYQKNLDGAFLKDYNIVKIPSKSMYILY